MNNSPSDTLVSIVISVYNIKHYLSRCLYTIVNQAYRNLEIILVDDGSNDGSESICEDFAHEDERIRVIHQQNQGVATARNNGKNVATGKYMMFIDGDDYLHLDAVKTLYETICHDETCEVAMCDFIRTTSLNEDITAPWDKPVEIESLTQQQAISMLFATNRLDLTFLWNKLYRTASLREIDNRDYEITDDLDFNFRLFLKTDKIIWIHRPLYYYVQRPGSLTHSSSSLSVPKSVARVIADNLKAPDDGGDQYRALLLKKLFRKLAEISGRAWIAHEYSTVKPFLTECRESFQKEFLHHPELNVLERLGISCLLQFPPLAATLLKVTRNA